VGRQSYDSGAVWGGLVGVSQGVWMIFAELGESTLFALHVALYDGFISAYTHRAGLGAFWMWYTLLLILCKCIDVSRNAWNQSSIKLSTDANLL
jgi:hypothetical protein